MSSLLESQQYSDEALIRQAIPGDLEAFNQLVLRYQGLVYQHALALLGDQASAEDAAQEGFIKAFENMARFRGGSFRAWLFKIVTNSAYDILRRSRRHPTQSLFPEDEAGEEFDSASWLADPGPSVQATVEQNELSREIHRALDQLPDAFRAVLTLVDLYEVNYAEAAQAMRIPMGTVKSRLARARFRFMETLKGNTGYGSNLANTHVSPIESKKLEAVKGEIT